jgi:YVTN family beta-propeller protein
VYAIDRQTRLVASVSVGKQPFGVAYMNGYVYVANFGSSSVSVIDANSRSRVADVDLQRYGSEPTHLAVDFARGLVYVAMHRMALSGTPTAAQPGGMLAIVPNKWAVIRSVRTGQGSYGVAALPDLSHAWVSNRDTFDLVGVTLGDYLMVDEYATARNLPGSPYFVAANSPLVYVTHSAPGVPVDLPDQLTVFEYVLGAFNKVGTVTVGNMGSGGGFIAVFPTSRSRWSGTVWVTANKQLHVYSADLSQKLATYGSREGIGSDPYAIVIDTSVPRVYVADGNGDRVTYIDLP